MTAVAHSTDGTTAEALIRGERAIPNRLNLSLVVLFSGALMALLAWGARISQPWKLGLAAALFGLCFQANFSLLHEAAHRKLHTDGWWNTWLGFTCGLWFGMSARMLEITHLGHHLKNRTAQEAFDLYGPSDSRLAKNVAWYGMLIGFWYWLIPIANIFLLVFPRTYQRLADRWKLTDGIFREPPQTLALIRVQLLGVLLFPVGLIYGLGLPIDRLLLFYGVAGCWWSTTQYLEHAYSPRDVRKGAFNLSAPRLFSLINLHRELDLTHHLFPRESWIRLPALSVGLTSGPPYLRHYLRQWSGPQPSLEPVPTPLSRSDVV